MRAGVTSSTGTAGLAFSAVLLTGCAPLVAGALLGTGSGGGGGGGGAPPAPPPPAVLQVAGVTPGEVPTTGGGTVALELTGSGPPPGVFFGSHAVRVSVDGQPVPGAFWSVHSYVPLDVTLQFQAPPTADNRTRRVSIVAASDGLTFAGSAELTYRAVAPSLSQLEPWAVPDTGATVHVTGAGFTPGTRAVLGGTLEVATTVLSATELELAVPALAAGSVTLTLVHPEGLRTGGGNTLTVRRTPVTTLMAPTGGRVGGVVVVRWTTSDDNAGVVDVELSTDDGATYTTLISGLSDWTGSSGWSWDTTSLPDATSCRLRVVPTDIVLLGSAKGP